MNYFAHAIRFLDDPYFLSGTALPDWLSVVVGGHGAPSEGRAAVRRFCGRGRCGRRVG